MALGFFLAFLVGVVTVVAAEALGLLYLIRRLDRKAKSAAKDSEGAASQLGDDLDPYQSLDSVYNKQGVVWVLDLDKIPREQKKKREVMEVSPLRKYAKIKDRSLVLTELDGSHSSIPLKGCIITAVSATKIPSRKWAKRYPLIVENKTSVIYNQSRAFYIYLETSWEKEAWCKALRFASFDDKEKIDWFVKLNEEFCSYVTSLNAMYPLFLKPSMDFHAEPVEKENKLDGSSSKVRHFFKKITKKASKAGLENKAMLHSSSVCKERKRSEKSCSFQDAGSSLHSVNTYPLEEGWSSLSLPCSRRTRSVSIVCDTEADDKLGIDDGTLCWNLLISRLFFDAKRSVEMTKSLQARIQRTLSNMRIPTYMGDVICTGLTIGNLPPYIHCMRVLPMDMNEVWAFEIDIEYSDGLMLDLETRLEVRELELEEGIGESDLKSKSVREVASDLLEGFEYYKVHSNPSEPSADALEKKDVDPKQDKIQNSKSSTGSQTYVSRWKSIVNCVAKQVSQVPLTLALKVSSLRGTMQLHIKPPPSDRFWFGFVSMPDIDFNLEYSVGERRITSGRVALFLMNHFKAAIRESIVLPNVESVFIPGMLGEKEDWVPRNIAPFMWVKQGGVSDRVTNRAVAEHPSGVATIKTEVGKEYFSHEPAFNSQKPSRSNSSDLTERPEVKHDSVKNLQFVQPVSKSSNALASSLNSTSTMPVIQSCKSLQELTTPLLEPLGDGQQYGEENRDYHHLQSSGSHTLSEELNLSIEEDEAKPKRVGRRARMFDLGKKVGDKLEEKRRHIGEKGRHIVEKMRGPSSGQMSVNSSSRF